MRIDVRPAAARFVTRTDWLESRHCFSYGPHYDPSNTRFGLLVAHNDDVLQPGAGFGEHPHRDVEIVTWVVEGALRHSDDSGGSGLLRPGIVQRLSAGSGVRHSEHNASDAPTRYVQMWVLADAALAEGPPGYDVADLRTELAAGGFVSVASGRRPAPLRLCQPRVDLFAARLRAGGSGTAQLPVAPAVHLYVVSGAVLLGDVPLLEGDAARVTDAEALPLTLPLNETANAETVNAETADAELLAWAMDTDEWRPEG